MVRLAAAGAPAGSGLSAAEILGARKLLAAVLDDIAARELGSDKWPQLLDLHLYQDQSNDKRGLQHIGGDHDAQGN